MKLSAILCLTTAFAANVAAYECHPGDPNYCYNGLRIWRCASGGQCYSGCEVFTDPGGASASCW